MGCGMTSARSIPIFFDQAGRNGHLFDLSTSYVSYPPGGYDELQALDSAIWRYLYPYQVVQDCREAKSCHLT